MGWPRGGVAWRWGRRAWPRRRAGQACAAAAAALWREWPSQQRKRHCLPRGYQSRAALHAISCKCTEYQSQLVFSVLPGGKPAPSHTGPCRRHWPRWGPSTCARPTPLTNERAVRPQQVERDRRTLLLLLPLIALPQSGLARLSLPPPAAAPARALPAAAAAATSLQPGPAIHDTGGAAVAVAQPQQRAGQPPRKRGRVAAHSRQAPEPLQEVEAVARGGHGREGGRALLQAGRPWPPAGTTPRHATQRRVGMGCFRGGGGGGGGRQHRSIRCTNPAAAPILHMRHDGTWRTCSWQLAVDTRPSCIIYDDCVHPRIGHARPPRSSPPPPPRTERTHLAKKSRPGSAASTVPPPK